MRILDADARTLIARDRYCLPIEATPRAAALLFALGIESRYVAPSEDSGRAWYEFEYTPAFDESLKQLVDVIGDLIFNQPGFGQLTLFDAESEHA